MKIFYFVCVQILILRIDTIMAGKLFCHHLRDSINVWPSFLFDIFLGSNYNQSPPSVKFMTVIFYFVSLESTVTNNISDKRGEVQI